jgi:hypothetical protein
LCTTLAATLQVTLDAFVLPPSQLRHVLETHWPNSVVAAAAAWVVAAIRNTMLKFRGCSSFRQRLLLSTLSGRSVRIDDIRADDASPGLRDFEASFLRLLEKLTNGCVVEINETGKLVNRKPQPCMGKETQHISSSALRHLPSLSSWHHCLWTWAGP